MKIERCKVDTLILDPSNARRHPKANIDAIKASLDRFGQVAPLVVRNGIVIGGNGTLTAMRALGWEDVNIVQFEGTEKEAAALAIALNRTAELATWDSEQLEATLTDLTASDASACELGFTPEALAALLPKVAVLPDTDNIRHDPGELPSNSPKKKAALQYALLFDTDKQQQNWFALLERLKGIYPDAKNTADRIDALAKELTS
jgi:ParB-like chromosome segregation protein Spo0J